MTAVLVHGNPETPHIWSNLIGALDDDVICLSPPGFGAPVPPGWVASPERYCEWLVAELEALAHPVHLAGHDWGGAHVMNVAMTRPDLLCSWTTDSIGVFDEDFVWHQLAEIWQTPGDGETSAAQVTAACAEQRCSYLESLGIDRSIAATIAAHADEVSAVAMLQLYRAARQPVMRDLGASLARAAQRPGLVLLATDDTALGTLEMRRRAASRAGATTRELNGCGHWWMLEQPRQAADHIQEFWKSVSTTQTSGQHSARSAV